MALVSSSSPCSSHPFPSSDRWNCRLSSSSSSPLHTSMAASRRLRCRPIAASSLCTDNQTIPPSSAIDRSAVSVAEAFSEDQLWAAASLRVRSFYEFNPSSYRIEDHKKYLTEREFEALKERIAGRREEFRRVSCINATVPLSQISKLSDDLCASCKFSSNGEDRVVVGTLDLNQCIRLPDEIVGKKPQGIGADFARAYLSNVCVAAELHRHGLGYAVIAKSKLVAQEWENI
ncbi:uncharacterized protein LOC21405807 isoform X2 [Morus notabilis]|uniref:uncharacterized protein LOC21405807 isoform X2 n=1 Tax=Morus notabilis TaxID=981085 RepID=UPI000CECE953|nr:uncharacterized protein LOC21405807 isoform X2 [Morus notabilis]